MPEQRFNIRPCKADEERAAGGGSQEHPEGEDERCYKVPRQTCLPNETGEPPRSVSDGRNLPLVSQERKWTITIPFFQELPLLDAVSWKS